MLILYIYIFIDLLKKENLDKEELDRLKISFAEGYLVARDQKGNNTTKTQKWWKIIQSAFIVGISLATLVSLFSNNCLIFHSFTFYTYKTFCLILYI